MTTTIIIEQENLAEQSGVVPGSVNVLLSIRAKQSGEGLNQPGGYSQISIGLKRYEKEERQ